MTAPMQRILVPVDFSETSERAVARAVELARMSGGNVTLLHVGVVPHFYATELGMSGPSGALYAQLGQEVAAQQRERIDRLLSEAVPGEIASRAVVRDGFPPEEVLLQVADGDHDLVVMGTHGRTGVRRALLGSVTERVLRECPVPVLVTH
jgi:nucleotide-binding universal stress UspA family protein